MEPEKCERRVRGRVDAFRRRSTMRIRGLLLVATVVAVLAGGRFVLAQHDARPGVTGAPPAYSRVSAAILTRAGLPSEETAKTALSAALSGTRHPQWIDIPVGKTTVRSFVVFPDRADNRAPVMVITANNQGMSDWLRAVGDAAAADGFVAVVPDLLTGMGPDGGGTCARAADVQREAWGARLLHGRGPGVGGVRGDGGRERFLYRQDLGRNTTATEDAWPKAMAFFKRHLLASAATR